jgi:hypothetical protein
LPGHQRTADALQIKGCVSLAERASEIGAERVAGGFRGYEENAFAHALSVSSAVKP